MKYTHQGCFSSPYVSQVSIMTTLGRSRNDEVVWPKVVLRSKQAVAIGTGTSQTKAKHYHKVQSVPCVFLLYSIFRIELQFPLDLK